jgi:hypothetical protein
MQRLRQLSHSRIYSGPSKPAALRFLIRRDEDRSPLSRAPVRKGCEVLSHKLINVVVEAVVYAVDVC